MKVISDPGAGRLTKVHPEIEPVRPILRLNRALSSLGEIHEFIGDGLLRLGNQRQMSIRSNQQMPARIRVKVQDDKTPFSAVEHVTRLVGLSSQISGKTTKDTARFRREAFDVTGPPGAPQEVHTLQNNKRRRRAP